MGEKGQPTGIGRIYFTTAGDKDMEHLAPLEGPFVGVSSLHTGDDGQEDGGKKGFFITGTVRIDKSKLKRDLWRRLRGGRLPRREKKRRIMRIMRDKELLVWMLSLSLAKGGMEALIDVAAAQLFPDRIRTDAKENALAILESAQLRLLRTFGHRMLRNRERWLRREWYHNRTAFAPIMEMLGRARNEGTGAAHGVGFGEKVKLAISKED